MYDVLLTSLLNIFHWQSLLYLLLGSLLGLLFGILPGLGGTQVLALLLPITIGMQPEHAIVLLIGGMASTPIGGSLTAILLNTPGTAQNAATTFDGYQLTKQGKAGMAIGASVSASVLGSIFGAVILTIILPFGKYFVLAFSYPEYFMMAIVGLAMIAVLSKGSLWKALLAGGLGLMISFIGYDPVTGSLRYAFGTDYLRDGIKLVPALTGLFALSEAISLFIRKEAISNVSVQTSMRDIGEGIASVFRNFALFIRCSIIGTIIGIIPGVGGSVSNFLAYGHAVSSSKNPENFGKGDIRGVIGPESANNAKDGGAMVPTLLFGIPGSVETAVLLGALVLHGIQPGPRLILESPGIVGMLIYSLVLCHFIVGTLSLFMAPTLAKITMIKSTIIGPIVMVLAMVGSFATEFEFKDMIVTLIFGILGYVMKKYGYSLVSLVIAMVLGEMMQQSFHQTIDVMGYAGFFTRPISLTLFVITVLSLTFPAIKRVFFKKEGTR